MHPTVAKIEKTIAELRRVGAYKSAPLLDGPMGPTVRLADRTEVVNLCSNNYLGPVSYTHLTLPTN